MPKCDVCVTFNNNKPIMKFKTRLEQKPKFVIVKTIASQWTWFEDRPDLSIYR